jgi:hypothetical protein
MAWKWIVLITLAAAVAFALMLGVVGFLLGAGVGDENAGEAAVLLGGIGLVAGFVGGALLAFVPLVIVRLLARREEPPKA